MPHVHEHAFERDAGRAVHLGNDPVDAQDLAVDGGSIRRVDPDVGALQLLVDVVRALGQLGHHHAGRQGTGRRTGDGRGGRARTGRGRRHRRSDGGRGTGRGHDADRRDPHQGEDLAAGQDATDEPVVIVLIERRGGGWLERLERHRKDLDGAVVDADPRLAV